MELQQRITLYIELQYKRVQLFTLKDFPFHTIKPPFLGIYDIFCGGVNKVSPFVILTEKGFLGGIRPSNNLLLLPTKIYRGVGQTYTKVTIKYTYIYILFFIAF